MIRYATDAAATERRLIRELFLVINPETGHPPERKDRLAHDAIADTLNDDPEANVVCPE